MKIKNISVKSNIKAGSLSSNHNRLAVRSAIKAGSLSSNHNRAVR